jgi:hypothetical protein
MDTLSKTLKQNVKIMRSRVTKYAVYGALIALAAIVAATLLSSYFMYGDVSLININQWNSYISYNYSIF